MSNRDHFAFLMIMRKQMLEELKKEEREMAAAAAYEASTRADEGPKVVKIGSKFVVKSAKRMNKWERAHLLAAHGHHLAAFLSLLSPD